MHAKGLPMDAIGVKAAPIASVSAIPLIVAKERTRSSIASMQAPVIKALTALLVRQRAATGALVSPEALLPAMRIASELR
jgi:hypothetical protein